MYSQWSDDPGKDHGNRWGLWPRLDYPADPHYDISNIKDSNRPAWQCSADPASRTHDLDMTVVSRHDRRDQFKNLQILQMLHVSQPQGEPNYADTMVLCMCF